MFEFDEKKELEKISKFLQATFEHQVFEKAVVAVSGGIDSACALLLTAKALSPENVYALTMPAKQTADQDIQDARIVMEAADIPEENRLEIPITAIVQKSWRVIKRHQDSKAVLDTVPEKGVENRKQKVKNLEGKNRLRLANITARSRMMVVYDQAKRLEALVVGTENKSEHYLGYFTRYGDEASDVEPLKHLYKTQVWELAKQLGVPEQIIEKEPSAGLWSGQTDRKELGFKYLVADPVLYLAFEQNLSAEEIYKKLPDHTQEQIKAVLSVAYQNMFKHQVPYSLEDE